MYTPNESYQNENEYLNRLGSISSFIKDSECTCIFVLGDLKADISDDVIIWILNQFCVNNKLVLSSKVLLPYNNN